ncbi:MAG: hypothetical protein PHG82_04320 [Candidatus Gracilibacteria bacterium]|nr:hypothetical protein [Candidatus Gracilibacteria bacterium]
MRKILSIFLLVFMLLNTSLSFAGDFKVETKLSAVKQESYKKQINSVYKGFENKISKISEEKQILNINTIVSKIDILLKTKLSDKNNYILSYLNYLLKDKLEKIKNLETEIKQKQLLEKQAEEDNKKILSSDDRPIGTIEITAPNYSYDKGKNLVYEIITTNNIVKGYELYKNLKTGEFETSYYTELENGFYNNNTKEIYVSYHRWRYEYIQEDLMTFSNSFTIKGTDVYYGNSKIGVFFPNQLQIQKQDNIPFTQGCIQYWSDNTADKIYYDKNSKFYNDILEKTKYNYNYVYFCSEDEAIKDGYKKSLN